MTAGKIAAQYVLILVLYCKFLTSLFLDAGELLTAAFGVFFFFSFFSRIINRHATLACYKALVKANPKVSCHLPSVRNRSNIIAFLACTTLGNDRVCFGISSWIYSASDIKTQTSENCAKS